MERGVCRRWRCTENERLASQDSLTASDGSKDGCWNTSIVCRSVIIKDYVEVNDKKCCEVNNCMCVKHKNGKKYCMGCGNVVPARKEK